MDEDRWLKIPWNYTTKNKRKTKNTLEGMMIMQGYQLSFLINSGSMVKVFPLSICTSEKGLLKFSWV
jgi:hypothetical protein